MIDNEIIATILKKKGDIRGTAFKSIADYIVKQKGEDGLRAVELLVEKWTSKDFETKNIKSMAWYPISWGALFVLASQEVFSWNESEIRKMGVNGPKVSILVKLFFKLFPSIEKLAEQIPNFWRKNYTTGEIKVISFDEQKKYLIFRLYDCFFHPLLCKFIEGFSETAFQLSSASHSKVKVSETKCSFKDGTPYEEYLVKWT